MNRRAKAALRRAIPFSVVPIGCVLGLVMVLSVGGIVWHTSTSLGHDAHAQQHDAGTVPVATTQPVSSPASTPLSPTRIDIPKLHASAPVTQVGTTPDNELDVPLNPRVVGWWSPGAKPGAKTGTAVFAGHINYAGVTGTFSDIGKLNPGDKVEVHGKFGSTKKVDESFVVAAVKTYHKTALPYQQIFDQKVAGRIALVTCGGPFDYSTGNYLDNIVVYAVPVAI